MANTSATAALTDLIHWPALIKYHQDDELYFLANADAWHHDLDMRRSYFDSADRLVDSSGVSYCFEHQAGGAQLLTIEGELVDLATLTAWVQAHYSTLGNLCVAKIAASSIAELIQMVGVDQD